MIITLCGSSKFEREFMLANAALTLQEHVVISLGIFGHARSIELAEHQKRLLDNLHRRKIHMADMIFVIDVNGYIGSSTRSEIEYAQEIGHPVHYWSEEGASLLQYLTEQNITLWSIASMLSGI